MFAGFGLADHCDLFLISVNIMTILSPLYDLLVTSRQYALSS
jgi:hypothetical protein